MFGKVSAQIKKNEVIEVVICGEKHLVKSEVDDEVVISNNDNCVAPQIKLEKSTSVNVKPKKKNRLFASVPKPVLAAEVVKTVEPIPLLAPVLVRQSIRMSAGERTKKIGWQPVPNADLYKIKVIDEYSPDTDLQNIETKDQFFLFQAAPEINKYKFTVEAISDKKEYMPSISLPGRIEIIYSKIQILEQNKTFVMNARTSDQSAKTIDYQIQWEKTPRASYYNVEFSESPEFDKISDVQKTNQNSFKSQLVDFGKKYYRIKAYSAAGHEITQSTTTASLDYIKKFDLVAPEIEPKSKMQSLFFQNTAGQFIRLAWNGASSDIAPNYYLEISKTADFENIIKSYSTTSPFIVLNESIPQGQYFWRVKSYGKDIISNWSDSAQLKIKSIRNLASEKK